MVQTGRAGAENATVNDDNARVQRVEAAAAPDTTFTGSFESGELPACQGFYSGAFTPVTGQVTVNEPNLPRPSKGSELSDSNFHTCVVRATDWAAEPPEGFARNDYSRRQAFNADSSKFLVYSLNGFWHLYDAATLRYVKVLPGLAGDAEPQWHSSDPNLLYYVATNGGTKLLQLNVSTGVTTTAADFAGRLPWSGVAHVWTKSEGSPSADGRYWCFMAENSGFTTLGVFAYDLQTNTILGSKAMTNRPDHVSMSPSGRWCVVSHIGGLGGTVAWNTTFTQSRQLHLQSEHSDIALGAGGHDVYVAIDYQSNNGDMFMVDIDTGTRTTLFPTYVSGNATAYHISGKAFAKPGWIVVSTYLPDNTNTQWYHQKIMAVSLSANPTIYNLAQHHVRYNGYWTEPHASVNRDFTRVLFNSNWGTSSDLDVDAYLIALPPTAVQ